MQHDGSFNSEARYDAVLVGAGIMSATLAALLHELDPVSYTHLTLPTILRV